MKRDEARCFAPDYLEIGVADGTRTRDVLDHNQVLYQLNYSHHMHKRSHRYTCNEVKLYQENPRIPKREFSERRHQKTRIWIASAKRARCSSEVDR